MRTLLTALALLLASAPLANAGKAVKIAYVDMQRALLQVEEGKKAKSKLEKMKKDRQKKLDASQEELRALQKDFEAQKEFMEPAVRRKKEGEFRSKLMNLQKTYAGLQRELAVEEAKLSKGIFARMGNILQKMGKKGGFTMIFEKTESSLLWAEQHLDLTNELIRRYNAGEGKKK